jgi:predicted alpha/beta-fold hydrolase
MIVRAEFDPPWWLRNRHLQTIVPNTFRRPPRLELRRETVELPDGDFVHADWTPRTEGPIVALLHGLEGNINSPYAAGMLHALHAAGWRAVLLHFRGCSGVPNRLPRAYHSGDTAHLEVFFDLVAKREPGVPIAAVGFSLGGNALLKWLGETGDSARLKAAVAVSVPFDLGECARAIDSGFAKVYQFRLMRRLKNSVRRKIAAGVNGFTPPPFDHMSTFTEFDDAFTAPLHGFEDAKDYYTRCSSRQFLPGIRTPTLIVHAADDPFMSPAVVPTATELSPTTRFELAAHGGHTGFLSELGLGGHRIWTETRVPGYLRQHLE